MNRTFAIMGLIIVGALAIGFGLSSAVGQQATGVDFKVLNTVDLGPDCPGYIARMRYVTLAPGADVPMHSHKERPEVAYILKGTLTDQRKGAASTQEKAGTSTVNGREIEHEVHNKSGKPVVVIGVDVIKKEAAK
jgi:quercetin dioxygenase-like cupin family protein